MEKNERLIELDDAGTWSVSTEEFLAHIHRSSELMRQERGDEARKLLKKAFEARMDDPSGQATLGLVYFKLGIYPRALAIYRKLVQDYPQEPTLRLNLGLVYLKTGQTECAARELEAAVTLSPEYRKAHGYLGLAYQRLGDWFGAKRAFEKAGAKHLAERMARFVEPESKSQPEAAACGSLDLGYSNVPEDERSAGLRAGYRELMAELPFSSAAPMSVQGDRLRPAEPVTVAELLEKAKIPEPLGSRLLISEAGYLLFDIQTRGVCRLDGLHFLSASHLSYKPLKRRYRGKDIGEQFGAGDTVMYEIEGSGRLGFHPSDGVFSAVSLSGEAAFIREEYLFALDPSLTYENGKIPGEGSMLVHISGTGALAMKTPDEPTAVEVTPSSGVIVPGGELVGWFGRLLPKRTSVAPFTPDLDPMEITGEGVVLFCRRGNSTKVS